MTSLHLRRVARPRWLDKEKSVFYSNLFCFSGSGHFPADCEQPGCPPVVSVPSERPPQRSASGRRPLDHLSPPPGPYDVK